MIVTKNKPLTPAEKRCLDAFRTAKRKAKSRPSLGQVAHELRNSKPYTFLLIKRLIAKGRMEQVSRYAGYQERRRRSEVAA